MVEKLKNYLAVHRVTVILIAVIGLLIFGGITFFRIFNGGSNEDIPEVDLNFDPEGPYALTYPRRDGNAMVLNLKRTSSYDSITYELAYTSTPDTTVVQGAKSTDEEGGVGGSIDRGVQGTLDTKDKKGEYEQEILFGTCSKSVCKYDQGVENGTLTLHIRKGGSAYRMVTQWHLQKPDVALGSLSSGDGHFIYKVDTERQTLSNVGFSIINDLTGVPKLPSEKEILGKVYALNIPIAKGLPGGDVTFELAQNPPDGAKLYRYDGGASKWEEIDTKVEGSELSGKANGAGIFAILVNK